MSSLPLFLASSICALIVFLAALTAWLRGDDWNSKLPSNVPILMGWMYVWFVLACVTEVS